MTIDRARVAICIPVHRDAEGLRTTLESIGRLHPPISPGQVHVAIDGRDEPTERVATAFGARVAIAPVNRGAAAARNLALDLVAPDAEAVLFTDAGCTVAPAWLDEHLESLEHVDLSGGGVRFTFSARPTPAEVVDARRHLQQRRYVEQDGFAATCNLAVRREVVAAVRFDEHFTSAEDVDFCHRATAAGFRIGYCDEAYVEHPARRSGRELLAKVRRLTGAMALQPDRWAGRRVPKPRLGFDVWRHARASGLDVGRVWGARAGVLDYLAARALHRTARSISDVAQDSRAADVQ